MLKNVEYKRFFLKRKRKVGFSYKKNVKYKWVLQKNVKDKRLDGKKRPKYSAMHFQYGSENTIPVLQVLRFYVPILRIYMSPQSIIVSQDAGIEPRTVTAQIFLQSEALICRLNLLHLD